MSEFKDKIIEDLISICSIPNISETTLHECLRLVFSWALTARDDDGNSAKYFGCPYWSENALKQYDENKNDKDLRHEHVIPRAIFNSSIENYRNEKILNPNITYEECFNDLQKHISDKLFACVITKEENKKFSQHKVSRCMPNGEDDFFNISDKWARYKKAGVTDIYEVKWEKQGKKSNWKYHKIKKLTLN